MKILLLILTLASYSLYGQGYAQSPKLGEEDGISGFKLGSIYSNSIKGIHKLEDKNDAWSEMKNQKYVVTAAYLVDPALVGLEKYYGLEVERIELFVNDLDVYDDNGEEIENSFILNSIAVFIKPPKKETLLSAFYAKVKKEYAPLKDDKNESGKDRDLYILWISTTECGAMMRLGNFSSLDAVKEKAPQFIPLLFTGSCGG